jgi:hypothetical protein
MGLYVERYLTEPCPFCGETEAALWHKPDEDVRQYQVVCANCDARGPQCDCGEESAVPAWLSVKPRPREQVKDEDWERWERFASKPYRLRDGWIATAPHIPAPPEVK